MFIFEKFIIISISIEALKPYFVDKKKKSNESSGKDFLCEFIYFINLNNILSA